MATMTKARSAMAAQISKPVRKNIDEIFARADVQVGGSRPWDIQIHNERFYGRVLRDGALGLGEAYMEGWWDAERLDEFFHRVLQQEVSRVSNNWRQRLFMFGHRIINRQRKAKAFEIGEFHYDIGNDLYEFMLDARMVYSCAYWRNAANLDEAQEAKLDLICRKLDLRPGMHVLDIGCGWGSFAKFAAEQYGVQVVGINNSREQTALARERCRDLPVEIRRQDYRDVSGSFHHVISVGMFEHVGVHNYATYMDVVHRCLRDEGLFLLHTIGNNRSTFAIDRWMGKYIFPGAATPSVKQIGEATEGRFIMEDWHNFGADYDKTLMAWFGNFDANWEQLRPKYGEKFYRMWKYYLLSCAGAFRARRNQLWQIVLSKEGVPGGYRSVR